MLEGEKPLWAAGRNLIAGSDEAGRGPLAGPLYVAMVVLPKGYSNPFLDDSKKLTARRRDFLFDSIKSDAVAYAIVRLSAKEVDELNPYEASRRGMYLCLDALSSCQIDFLVTDCMPLPKSRIETISPARADGTFLSVAAASILAKVSRDREMTEIDRRYPGYGFAKNKGYGTKEHLLALREKGPIAGIHRFSYAPVRELVERQIALF